MPRSLRLALPERIEASGPVVSQEEVDGRIPKKIAHE